MGADAEFESPAAKADDANDAVRNASVAVVLVNWNGWRDAIECVSSLLTQDHADFHIYLVDNDSQDQSIEKIQAWCREPGPGVAWKRHAGVRHVTDKTQRRAIAVRIADRVSDEPLPPASLDTRLSLVRAGGNRGFAAGCNIGIRAAGLSNYEYFWLLNTDASADRDALRALIRRARSRARIGITGSTILDYDSPEKVQVQAGASFDSRLLTTRLIGAGTPRDTIDQDPSGVESAMIYVTGASMLVSREFIEAVGPMQEDYFLYYEEFDWALRGRKQGFGLAYAPESIVFHKGGASSSRKVREFSSNLYYRNRIRFAARYFPNRLGVVRYGLSVDLLRHVVRGRWLLARIVARSIRNFSAIAASASER